MKAEDSQKAQPLSGSAVLRPMTERELAAVPRLSKEAIDQAVARGAAAIAAAEASAIAPAGYPKVRLR